MTSQTSQLEDLQAETLPLFASMSLKTSAQHHIEGHKSWVFNFLGPPVATPGEAGAAPSCPRLSCPVPMSQLRCRYGSSQDNLEYLSGTFITWLACTNSIKHLIKCENAEYEPLSAKANVVNGIPSSARRGFESLSSRTRADPWDPIARSGMCLCT